MTTLTSRERLERVLRGQALDRMPIRLWGVDPLQPAPRPAWQPLHDLANEFALDTFFGWSGEFPPSPIEIRHAERETTDPEWYEHETIYLTPAGPLSTVHLLNRRGKPGYVKKHLIESVDDARRWLAIPDGGLPRVEGYAEYVTRVGDRGMVQTCLGEAMYTVNDATGSELWGYWMYDERELVHEMVAKAAAQLYRLVRHYLENGVTSCFAWVGPELCIPPLASPADFEDFCVRYDQPIIDLIHNAGGFVWLHCHGDMHPVLERFADIGIDCLNPIEPPPIGKLTLADAKRRVGHRMTLEGGFEVGDFELETPQVIAEKVADIIAMGKPDGRFILCPSSDHTHWPEMDDKIVLNYRTFVETAVGLAGY